MSSAQQRQEEGQKRRLFFLYCWASQHKAVSGIRLDCVKRIKYKLFKITRPFRFWIDPPSAKMIPIHILFFTQSQTAASIHSPVKLGCIYIVAERRFMIPMADAIPEKRDAYKDIIEGFISTMVILPENIQPTVMQTIYNAIEKAEPGWPIDVVMLAVTVDIMGKSLVPTTKSVFQHLDNVRIDSPESPFRQMPCCICGKSLDQFYDAGEGVTRLPCSHFFHVGCFVQCLRLIPGHVCPTCSHQLCIVNAPTTIASEARVLPALLMASAGSILLYTGVLIGRLLVRRALE